MNPKEIKSVLSTLGGGANKRLGQHFLIDQKVLQVIADAACPDPGMLTLEIGPGLGVLTKALLERGCEVVAIERDGRFVEYLSGLHNAPQPPLILRGGVTSSDLPLKIRGNEGVMMIRGDAAKIDWMSVVQDRAWQLISNLPYSISSLALRKALWSTRPAENVVVLVQKEVGERVIAISPPYEGGVRGGGSGRQDKTSLLSLMVALASSSVRILERVPAAAFYPPPKVESVVLQITPMPWPERIERWGIDPEEIMKIAKLGFAHPRKLLFSNLKSVLKFISVGAQGLRPVLNHVADRDPIQGARLAPLREIGIPEKARAEDVSPEQWAALTKWIVEQKQTTG